jgi:hypothetical protein
MYIYTFFFFFVYFDRLYKYFFFNSMYKNSMNKLSSKANIIGKRYSIIADMHFILFHKKKRIGLQHAASLFILLLYIIRVSFHK